MSEKLSNAEAMTLGRLLEWNAPFPPYTRWATVRDLVNRGLIDLRVTARGVTVLNEHEGRAYEAKTPYEAQVRGPRYRGDTSERGWTTLSASQTEHEAADALWHLMQQSGFRTGELREHVADLAKGHVLTAEDGTAFRVIRVSAFDQENI